MPRDFDARAQRIQRYVDSIQRYVDSMFAAVGGRAKEEHEWLWRTIAAKLWEKQRR